jgi:CxxC motif-containing protein
MEKKLICVSCPVGCEITVKTEGDRVVEITGNRCPRGETYARQETIAPMRVLPTSVKVRNGKWPLVSVKTDRPVSKHLIAEIMELVQALAVEAPVDIGQVIAEDLLGTDANLVATRNVQRIRNGDGRDSPST